MLITTRIMLLWCLAFGLGVTVASGQTPVIVQPAELATGFDATSGGLVVLGDHIVWVDDFNGDDSFAVARSNIESFDRAEGVITIGLRTPVRNQRRLMFRLERPAEVADWFSGGAASSTPTRRTQTNADGEVTFQVRHDHLIGGCTGRLMLLEDRLAFESLDERNDSRQWAFADISELSQDGIYKLKVRPFLGNEYNLELIGRGMDSRQFRELSDRIANARAR